LILTVRFCIFASKEFNQNYCTMFTDTITLQEEQYAILSGFKQYGFKTKNELLSFALQLFVNEMDKKVQLQKSADLYADLYENDSELQELTETAVNDLMD